MIINGITSAMMNLIHMGIIESRHQQQLMTIEMTVTAF